MLESFVAIVTLICVIIFLLWFIRDQKLHFAEVEKDLLNRILARNYETFVQGDVVRAEVKKSLTDEEIMELQAERGIPV
jgi:hypothetical protein